MVKPALTDAAHLPKECPADLAMRAFSLAIPRVFSEGENRTGELTAREDIGKQGNECGENKNKQNLFRNFL